MKLARTATKFIFCLLATFFIIGIVPSNSLTAFAEDGVDQPIYEILTDNDGYKYVEITGYEFNDGDYCIDIPEEIEGYPVKSIGENAFSNGFLEEVYMPDSIVSIGDYAFSRRHGSSRDDLTKVVFSKNLKTIGNYAFYRCGGLNNITPLPDSLENIGDYAFSNCSGFSELCIGNNVKSIGKGAFSSTQMQKLTIGDNVTYIGVYAFNSSSLNTVNLGRCTADITNNVFSYNLTSVIVDKNNEYYTNIDGVLYTKDMSTLVLYPCKKSGTQYNIPNSVTKINDYAFYNCSNLTGIDIPNSVQYIGTRAFSHCEKLTEITIPSSVISFGDYTFTGATNLESIYIQNGLTSIGKMIIYECPNLKNIFIPNSVTSIDKKAFYTLDENEEYTINVTIYGYKGSYAEEYAKSYNIKFLDYILSTPNITDIQATGARSINLKWSNTVGASGYRVYRSTKQTGGWSKIAIVDGESTLTYTDNNAVPGTQYYYTVKAYLSIGGINTYSDYNKTGFAEKSTFTTPKILRTRSQGYNRISVYWDQHLDVDGFYLYRSTNKYGGWRRIATVINRTGNFYTDTDVEYNTQYYYTIRSYVKIDNTIYKSAYVKTGFAGRSVAMTPKVSVEVKNYNSATIEWDAWHDADGYIVYRTTNSNNTGWKVVKTMKATDPLGSYTDKNLECGTTYYYTVRSYEIVDGKKMKSSYEKYGKPCKPIPSTPKVTATQQKNKTVVISWNKIAGATRYKVYRRVPGGSWSLIKTITDVSTLSYKDTPPNKKTQYEYTVKAYHNKIAGKYKAVTMTMYTAY